MCLGFTCVRDLRVLEIPCHPPPQARDLWLPARQKESAVRLLSVLTAVDGYVPTARFGAQVIAAGGLAPLVELARGGSDEVKGSAMGMFCGLSQ